MNKKLKKLIGRIEFKFARIRKYIYQMFLSYKATKTIIFVVGCQRSGTSLMMRIFDRDHNSKVFRELDDVFSETKSMRLKELPLVKNVLDLEKVRLVVAKPLLDSQHCSEILDAFPGSYALWMYRNYKDVAKSNLNEFGIHNGIKDILPVVQNQNDDWRAEYVSEDTRQIIKRYYSEDMNPHDASALFWYLRNIMFFELKFDCNPGVIVCKYEDLVSDPHSVMQKIYTNTGIVYPGSHIVKDVHTGAKGRGTGLDLLPEIDSMCNTLWEKLNNVYEKK